MLFNNASIKWQLSIGLELLAGLIGVVATLLATTLGWQISSAICVVVLLLVAYYLWYSFEKDYDNAETMRRQSVLTEGLGWPMTDAQFSHWKSRVASKLLQKALCNKRDDDYYTTTENVGPERLLQMTQESVFWTRNLYERLFKYILVCLVLVVISLIITLNIAVLPQDEQVRLNILHFIYLVIPLLLTIDFFGLVLRLHRAIQSLLEVERDLDRLTKAEHSVEHIMRLVAEYNCILASGVPIPNWLFSRHHDEIQACWKE